VRVLIYSENVQEAPVAVFPEFSLCQSCGKADFVLSRADLCFLEKRQEVSANAVPVPTLAADHKGKEAGCGAQ